MDKLFKFKGRADKLEFVKTLGILYLIAFVVKYINYDVLNAGNNVLLISIYVLLAVSSTAAFFRRLHDIGLPGYISFTSWILLTLIIPSDYLGGIVCSVFWGYIAFFVYLIIRDSQPYSNKYGESLKVLDKQDIVHSEIKNRQMINKIILSMLGLKTIIMILYALWCKFCKPLGVPVLDIRNIPLYIIGSISFILILIDFTRRQILTIIGAVLMIISIITSIIYFNCFAGFDFLKYLSIGQLIWRMFGDCHSIVVGVMIIFIVSRINNKKEVGAKFFVIMFFIPTIWGICYDLLCGKSTLFLGGSAYYTFLHCSLNEIAVTYLSKFIRALSCISIYNRMKIFNLSDEKKELS